MFGWFLNSSCRLKKSGLNHEEFYIESPTHFSVGIHTQLSMGRLPEYEFFAVHCIVSIQRWLVWCSSWRSYDSALGKDLMPNRYVVLDEERMEAVQNCFIRG